MTRYYQDIKDLLEQAKGRSEIAPIIIFRGEE
jgi:hypothetical protein